MHGIHGPVMFTLAPFQIEMARKYEQYPQSLRGFVKPISSITMLIEVRHTTRATIWREALIKGLDEVG